MSPAPTPGADLRPNPCVEAEEGGKSGGGGRCGGGPGAGVERHASKVVQHACCQDRPSPLCSGHRTTKRLATDHKLKPSFLEFILRENMLTRISHLQ